ncbi:MAG: VOC family protein [Gammaproteobacteria bacterium]
MDTAVNTSIAPRSAAAHSGRISSSVVYQDAAAAIHRLCEAFGFEVRLKIEGDAGRIEHSELIFGEGLIMVSQESPDTERPWKRPMRSPNSLGGACTQAMMIFVDDAQAHYTHARGHGARIVEEPATHDYGEDYWTDLSYGALDLEGHLWWITQRLRDQPAH